MERFESIFARAAERKGGADALEALLPKPKTVAQLKKITDDRYLSEMSKCIFRSGFVWKIVENKWPDFEDAFAGFDTMACAMLDDEQLLKLGRDARIIRHPKKITAVRDNAWYIREIRESHGSFGAYIASWPGDDIIGLWNALKRGGSRLGGNTGQYFLRFMGKDTFILSRDVVTALVAMRVVDKTPTSKKAQAAVQDAFNSWQQECGRPLSQISRVLSCSVG